MTASFTHYSPEAATKEYTPPTPQLLVCVFTISILPLVLLTLIYIVLLTLSNLNAIAEVTKRYFLSVLCVQKRRLSLQDRKLVLVQQEKNVLSMFVYSS